MNQAQTKECIAVMQAFLDGKQIQFHNKKTDRWEDAPSGVSWDWRKENYRIKPEPKLRPWKPEEVPVGAVVRCGQNRWLITACWQGKPFLNGCDAHDDERAPSLQTLTQGYEHSPDHGKTWLPCGVMEE